MRFGRAAALAATIMLASCNQEMLVGVMRGPDLPDSLDAADAEISISFPPDASIGTDVSSSDTSADAALGDAIGDASAGSDATVDMPPNDAAPPDDMGPMSDATPPNDATPPADTISDADLDADAPPDVPRPDGPLCPSSARAPVSCVAPDASAPETPLEDCPMASRTILRENELLSSLQADAQGIYWRGSDLGLRVLRKDAAAPQLLGFMAPQQSFAFDADALYFATGDDTSLRDIKKIKRDGTGLTFLASGAMVGTEIVLGADRVYFQPSQDGLRSVSKAGGGPAFSFGSGNRISHLVADATHVYWMESSNDASTTSTSSVIWRATHGVVAQELVITGLATDEVKEQGAGLILFSQTIDAGSGDDVAWFREVPKTGGCARVLVALPKSRCSCRVTTFAVDDRAIYWIAAKDAGGFSVWYAPRSGGIAVEVSAALSGDNLALAPTQVLWGDVVPAITTFATLIQAADRP
jgi:hypothetical protein